MKRMLIALMALAVFVPLGARAEAGGDRPDARHAWSVHDVNRPDPKVVEAKAGMPPGDAIVLFDGTDGSVAKYWRDRNGKPSRWIAKDGEFVCVPGSGPAVTAEKFGDCQLHLEFKTPIGGENATGNSGVIFMGEYEVQILNSYGITPSKSLWKRGNYADGQIGAVYGQNPPLVNVCRPRGEWQTYDIIFHPPYREGERLVDPGSVTVFLNGVVVQDHWQLEGVTMWNRRAPYHTKQREAPLHLQDHGNPVPFRNIWIRRIPSRYANTTCGGPGVKQADVAELRHRLAAEALAAAEAAKDPAEKFMRLWESFCYEPDRKVKAMIVPAEAACVKAAIERKGCLSDDSKRQATLRFVEMLEIGRWIKKDGALRKALSGAPVPLRNATHDFIYQVDADKADCHYRCGELATFVVTVLYTNGEKAVMGKIAASLDNFGTSVQTNATFDLALSNPFRIAGTLRKPGFLRLNLPATKDVRRYPAVFSVAYEPQRIEKGSPSPGDFDEFWANAVRRLDETVPADPQLRLLHERSTDKFNFWRISFATYGGARVHGYLSIPKDASAEKRYPVRFEVPAAGGGRAGWTNNMHPESDAICMTMTVHPYEPPFDLDALEKLFNANLARLKDKYGDGTYPVAGLWKSREDYYFYPAILGINRAVNWLASRPEVNRASFTYRGTSQGGGFGLYLLGLNRNFTKGALFVPAISDTMGYLKGRESSWPRPVDAQRSKGADRMAAAERNAPYFDGANFAARIRCPIRIAVGFSDITCPPCGVYAAFNAMPVNDKAILDGIGMTHSCRQQFYKELAAWLCR